MLLGWAFKEGKGSPMCLSTQALLRTKEGICLAHWEVLGLEGRVCLCFHVMGRPWSVGKIYLMLLSVRVAGN